MEVKEALGEVGRREVEREVESLVSSWLHSLDLRREAWEEAR